jgi:hypothetical protein
MNRMIIPPFDPKQSEPVRPSMVYVKKSLKWEYKQIVRNLSEEGVPDEGELNALGEEGWELTGVAQQSPLAFFYFKRVIEK